MYLLSLSRGLTVAMLFVLSWSTSVLASATVSIPPSGNSSYTVHGSTMDGVAGIQLDITYDTASLSTPTVTLGGLAAGAMLSANTSRPGLIKIAIISTRAFSGSGQIAAISFASKTGNGGITSFTTRMIDNKQSTIASSTINPLTETAAQGNTSTPGVPFSQPSQQAASATSTTAISRASSGTPQTYLGTVTLPTDQLQRADSQPAPSSTVPVHTEEPAAGIAEQTQATGKAAADAKVEETQQYVVYKGILDRFKQIKGSKKLSDVAALFDKKVAQNIHQEPAILSSNGQNIANLTIEIPARINTSPNFAVNGGTLVSFRQDKQIKGRWIVEVLPEAGSLKVTVTIIAGVEEFEFPLTVTPPIKTTLTLNESGWDRFIKEAGTATSPQHDFNNDGVRDYMDEFIFVANYIARKTTPARTASTTKKSVK